MSHAIGPLFGFERSSPVDLAHTNTVTIACALVGGERGSVWAEGWPDTVRAKIKAQAERWIQEHPDRELLLVSTGYTPAACFLIIHHKERPA